MFVLSVSSSKIKKYIFPVLVAIILIITAVICIFSGKDTNVNTEPGISYKASNSKERLSFISQFGWAVDEEPCEVREVIIPEEFDNVYNNYNEIQKKQGLDLTEYCGKRVKRWSYIVKNYPGYKENDECIRINLLVFDGSVIGGDVCSVELDGFMHTFAKEQGYEGKNR